MFVDVLLDDHWLVMLMDDFLMVFMEDVFSVLHNNILVMLVNNILMDLLDDGLLNVSSDVGSKFVPLDGLAFVGLLVLSLLLVSDHHWGFVDFLDNSLPGYKSLVDMSSMGVTMFNVVHMSATNAMFMRMSMNKIVIMRVALIVSVALNVSLTIVSMVVTV